MPGGPFRRPSSRDMKRTRPAAATGCQTKRMLHRDKTEGGGKGMRGGQRSKGQGLIDRRTDRRMGGRTGRQAARGRAASVR